MQTSSHGLKYAISIILRKVAIYDLAGVNKNNPHLFLIVVQKAPLYA